MTSLHVKYLQVMWTVNGGSFLVNVLQALSHTLFANVINDAEMLEIINGRVGALCFPVT